MSIVIVGASVAGIRTAQALRSRGYEGGITVLGEEPHQPYDKPPLSKAMLDPSGEGTPVPLIPPEMDAELNLELRLGQRAVSLDVGASTVTTDRGEAIEFEHLVIATGVTPRTLPTSCQGVYTLRDLDDAAAIRSELATARSAVAVGAGFIGAEFASAARASGVEVTVVEAQDTALATVLGEEVGRSVSGFHAGHGVELITGATVERFDGEGQVEAVVLADGRRIPADLVVVGIGAAPATQWLESSGIALDDGVVCDASLRVVGTANCYAVGDVARWPHALYETDLRIEHWTNANEHAELAAATILGQDPPPAQVPYVWSDQYGHRIQILGRPAFAETRILRDDPLAAVYVDAETVVGAVVVDDPRSFMKLRRAIKARAEFSALDVDLPGARTVAVGP